MFLIVFHDNRLFRYLDDADPSPGKGRLHESGPGFADCTESVNTGFPSRTASGRPGKNPNRINP